MVPGGVLYSPGVGVHSIRGTDTFAALDER
jgi:hypothetical protein